MSETNGDSNGSVHTCINRALNPATMPLSLNNTEAFLDQAAQHGIKVALSFIHLFEGNSDVGSRRADELTAFVSKCVQRFGDRPALLGWYLHEEAKE